MYSEKESCRKSSQFRCIKFMNSSWPEAHEGGTNIVDDVFLMDQLQAIKLPEQ